MPGVRGEPLGLARKPRARAGRPELLGGSGYEDALFSAYGFEDATVGACVAAQCALLAALLAAHFAALRRVSWDAR